MLSYISNYYVPVSPYIIIHTSFLILWKKSFLSPPFNAGLSILVTFKFLPRLKIVALASLLIHSFIYLLILHMCLLYVCMYVWGPSVHVVSGGQVGYSFLKHSALPACHGCLVVPVFGLTVCWYHQHPNISIHYSFYIGAEISGPHANALSSLTYLLKQFSKP